MAYLVNIIVSTLLALLALSLPEAIVFGIIMLIVSHFAGIVFMLPLGIILGILEKDMLKRKQIVDKLFMPMKFIEFLVVSFFAYRYSTLLPIAVAGSFMHWYHSYKYQEKKLSQHIS